MTPKEAEEALAECEKILKALSGTSNTKHHKVSSEIQEGQWANWKECRICIRLSN